MIVSGNHGREDMSDETIGKLLVKGLIYKCSVCWEMASNGTDVFHLVGDTTWAEVRAVAAEPPTQWVVAIGNPFDGVNLFGPFDSSEAAQKWAGEPQDDWWIVEIKEAK